ncbi:MAG: Gfo/Idh/MocA family oxidoreductase [Ignavibacteriales bacterium]|nr:Gfo/Idh/MocA family oxidoreductase [Ignavibacteriales bacterium]MCB9217821.1 Gfo/Idh/MocA family oxidoreductase [Ignavibacteriales bacterium]
MKVGIIGLGYWGPNLVRNFLAHPKVEKVYGCDLSDDRLNFIKSRFPSVELLKDYNEMLKKDIEIVAIATPVDTHFKFGKMALDAGKNIWVEKPFTATSDEAIELNNLADKNGLKIFVDHTFIYTGAVKKMRELVDSGEIGEIKYFDSVRINLGLFQHDVNVIWDLAPHDLSIMQYLMPHEKVVAVSAHGIANYYDHENLAHLSVYFENNCFAHFHVNWTSPVKIRKMLVGGDKKMLVFDDMENFEKIKIYDAGVEISSKEKIHEALVQYRMGDMHSPKVKATEALSLGVQEFISSILENRDPLTSGKDGLEVVKILEASEKSIKNKGKLIEINQSVLA